jgi:hypothetical protein
MRKLTYQEASFLERILPPIGKIAAWVDAYFVVFWARTLVFADRIVEKEAVMEGTFAFSGIAGIAFVFKTVSQKPELGISQTETMKLCLLFFGAVFFLRLLCFHSAKKTRTFPAQKAEAAIEIIRPFRSSSSITLLFLGGYEWYRYDYFYLAIATILAIVGMYTHSAIIYLHIKARITRPA